MSPPLGEQGMNAVERIVETKQASLETLAVTISALHVSGKQMTLAVFRQLPIRREDSDSELWGVVRYSIKDSGDVWLVFSADGRLYRRALNLNDPDPWNARQIRLLYEDRARYQKRLDDLNMARTEAMRRDPNWGESYSASIADYENKRDAVDADIEAAKRVRDDERANYRRELSLARLRQLFIAV